MTTACACRQRRRPPSWSQPRNGPAFSWWSQEDQSRGKLPCQLQGLEGAGWGVTDGMSIRLSLLRPIDYHDLPWIGLNLVKIWSFAGWLLWYICVQQASSRLARYVPFSPTKLWGTLKLVALPTGYWDLTESCRFNIAFLDEHSDLSLLSNMIIQMSWMGSERLTYIHRLWQGKAVEKKRRAEAPTSSNIGWQMGINGNHGGTSTSPSMPLVFSSNAASSGFSPSSSSSSSSSARHLHHISAAPQNPNSQLLMKPSSNNVNPFPFYRFRVWK